ncbi:MAG TPA: hypothetical protein VK147_06105 [Candidatus Didemnitutus sp.]|nr:hypothetical protein [Candidatus Didemnitutus sp.]
MKIIQYNMHSWTYLVMRASYCLPPWKRLRGTAILLASPGESVINDSDFDALR